MKPSSLKRANFCLMDAVKRVSSRVNEETYRSAVWPAWISALTMGCLLIGCGARLQPASVELMHECEARWLEHPVLSYHITVDVDAPNERRRNEVTVREGKVTRAVISYWDGHQKQWGVTRGLDSQQAFPFTVPGLFDTVQSELKRNNRTDIRVAIDRNYAFPQSIVLGPVLMDGHRLLDTAATVTVASFSPQSGTTL